MAPRGRPPRSVSPPDAEMLVMIEAMTAADGHPPSVRALQVEVGLASPAAMHRHLLRMRRAGLVTWEDGRPGTLRVVEPLFQESKQNLSI
jgi:SOS-response transcriptional repressor LexA